MHWLADSSERFWQKFVDVKIRKTKIWGLDELKMLCRVVEKRIVNIYKSQIKLTSNSISVWPDSMPVSISTH